MTSKTQDVSELIFVFAGSQDVAGDIRDLLEFMDSEIVEIANSANWRNQLGQRRLAAAFLGPDLQEDVRTDLMRDISSFDESVSLVVVDPEGSSATAPA